MSLYVLDTDITTLYRRGHEAVMRHALTHPPEELAITVITVEEQLSGWYALLRQVKASADLTRVYDHLVETVLFLSSTRILSFTGVSHLLHMTFVPRLCGLLGHPCFVNPAMESPPAF
jgi:tRNA(fMet)-specific endonuclease VapC